MKRQLNHFTKTHGTRPANYRLLCAKNVSLTLIGLMLAGPVSAAPTVSGTTISWPDDGWYQVQRASDYSSVCQGGRSCNVAPGLYNVINHTTGQRFEAVDVPPVDSGVVVSGNSIGWPDDGWYQVQNAADYTSLCEGGLSCEVPDGTYIVINHTTGQRFEGIVVPSGNHGVVVNGNAISWPDDGWYQVQSAVDYTSFCEGGRSCDVADGVYNVINHTTGERFENIVVGDAGPQNDAIAITVDNHADILSVLFDLFNGSYLGYGDYVISLPGFSDPKYNKPPEARSPEEAANPAPEVVACAGGGSATFTYSQSGFADISYGWEMQFDACHDVDNIYDGQLHRSENSAYEVVSSSGLRIDTGGNVTLYSGLLQWQARNARSGDSRSWSLTDFALRIMEADGTVVLNVENGDSTLFTFEPRFRSLEGSLAFNSLDTMGHTVIVTVIDSLRQDVPAGPDIENQFKFVQFESGELEVMADDGSSLLLNAASGVPETADIKITTPDGTSTEVEQPWSIWAHQLTCGLVATGEQGCL